MSGLITTKMNNKRITLISLCSEVDIYIWAKSEVLYLELIALYELVSVVFR